MAIITQSNVMWLPHALAQHHNNRVVAGIRVSNASQVYDGTAHRHLQVMRAGIPEAGGKLIGIARARTKAGKDRAQSGKLSSGRTDLIAGIDLAKRLGAILCFKNTARLLRAQAFHPVHNRLAEPTDEEWQGLYEMAGGIVLATLEPPDLSLEELHRRETAKGMCTAAAMGQHVGRPSRKGTKPTPISPYKTRHKRAPGKL